MEDKREFWAPIKGYEGLYDVSSKGRIKSHHKSRKCPLGFLKPKSDKDGYLLVNLYKSKKSKTFKVNRLVLGAFSMLGGSSCLHGAHLDGNKINNDIGNLRWVTRAVNESHKIIHGTLTFGERNGCAKLTSTDVLEIRRKLGFGYSLKEINKEYPHVSRSNLSLIKSRKNWRYI